MKRWLSLLLAVCWLSALHAQTGQPGEVDRAEVLRYGDRAVVAGEGPRSAGELLYTLAMAPPADDSDQWYVTVFGSSKDPATLAVKQAFETDPHLAAFVATPPGEGRRAWAHFNLYFADDPMQKFRFEQFKISRTGRFPCVVIQPPRDGSFGGLVASQVNGKTEVRMAVVDRIDAAQLGQPADLQRRITASVALWCQKLEQQGFVPPAKLAAKVRAAESLADRRLVQAGGHQQVGFPPWGPVNPPAAPSVNPQWPAGGPAAVANPTSAGLGFWTNILAIGLPLIITAATNSFLAYRETRTKNGQPLLLPDQMVGPFLAFLKTLSGVPATPQPPAPTLPPAPAGQQWVVVNGQLTLVPASPAG